MKLLYHTKENISIGRARYLLPLFRCGLRIAASPCEVFFEVIFTPPEKEKRLNVKLPQLKIDKLNLTHAVTCSVITVLGATGTVSDS